jgi:hypothetical protein
MSASSAPLCTFDSRLPPSVRMSASGAPLCTFDFGIGSQIYGGSVCMQQSPRALRSIR